MTGTTATPFTAISPSPAAPEWAKRTAEEFASGIDAMGRNSWAYRSTLPVQVEDALGRLYAPGLPDLIEEYDRIVRACAPPHAGVPGVGWDGYEGISTMRAGTPVRDLIDRCDDDLKPRLALWLAINARHPRHTEVDEQDRHLRYFSRIHRRAASTLFRAALPWDSALPSLLMHAEARGVVGEDAHIDVCEQVADPVLAPCVEQLQEYRAHCQERGEELFRYGPDDPWPHARGLLLLLRLGAPLALDHVRPVRRSLA